MIQEPGRCAWTAPPLRWVQFDDSADWVVFNPASAEVHLINDAAHRLWMLASDGFPRGLDELAGMLAGGHASEEARQLTHQTMAFMDEMGLLQPK